MKFTRFLPAAFAVGVASLVLAACGGGDSGPITGTTVTTLSNRADLISGGSALVEVKVPGAMRPASLKIDRDGTDITSAFTTTASGRIIGLVSGLKNGANTISATYSDGTFVGARLVITNHPIGGPVLLASQAGPWVCATPIPVAAVGNTPASNASGLSTAATDAQCNIATEFKLWYRTKTAVTVVPGDGGCSFALPDPTPTIAVPNPTTPANSCFQPYVAGTTPAASVASTTTTPGVTVPYIVRVERGTINRGIYDIAVLFDPTAPAWTATAPQAQWNGKVLYSFGASTGQPRLQFRTEQNWADDSALSRGFMVVDNSLTDSLYNSNRVLVNRDDDDDEGAHRRQLRRDQVHDGQRLLGRLDRAEHGRVDLPGPARRHPAELRLPRLDHDRHRGHRLRAAGQRLRQARVDGADDAGLTQAQINAKKTAINGHLDQTGCHGWNNSFGFNNKPGNYVVTLVTNQTTGAIAPVGAPRNNCMLPAALVYDPVTNPTGTRCGDPDLAAAVWGTTTGIPGGTSTRALTTNDNVGVQYGLKALLAGSDHGRGVRHAEREDRRRRRRLEPDRGALGGRRGGARHRLQGRHRLERQEPRRRWRSSIRAATTKATGTDIHYNWRSFSERARLDADAGSHANQVIWRYGTGPAAGDGGADRGGDDASRSRRWTRGCRTLLTSAPKASLNAVRTQAQVVAGKPAAAVDFCFLTGDVNFTTPITDQATCDADTQAEGLHVAAPGRRRAAGGEHPEVPAEAARLHRLHRHHLHGGQQTRLNAVFAGGVCDWSKPGVGQQDPISPLTFTAGPGGVAAAGGADLGADLTDG